MTTKMTNKAKRWYRGVDKIALLIMIVAAAGFLILYFRTTNLNSDIKNTQKNQTALVKKQATLTRCITSWANEFGDRSIILSDLSVDRQQKLDALIRSVATGKADIFKAKLADYIHSSNVYNTAAKKHPIPSPPKIACK